VQFYFLGKLIIDLRRGRLEKLFDENQREII